VFSLDGLSDRTFLIATGISVAVIYLGTTFSGLQASSIPPASASISGSFCILAGSAVVVTSEIRKLVLRTRHPDSAPLLA
jgi:hypothetical protein